MDLFGKTLEVGQQVVYPSRPGGHGPLVLGTGEVQSVEEALGQIIVLDTDILNARPVAIKRTDRVAVVNV